MALDTIAEPYKTRLNEIYAELPRYHSAVDFFDLSAASGSELWIAGQVPRFEKAIRYCGVVGDDVSIDDARAAARLCVANLLSILAAACDGDLSRVERVVRLTGYVRAVPDFGLQGKVLDAASEILNTLFGAQGRHARSAIGVHSLPGGASVELECVVRLKNGNPRH